MSYESVNLPYIALTGVVCLAIIASFVLYQPQFKSLQAARAEIASLTLRRGERQQFLVSIDQQSAQLRTKSVDEQELSVLLPSSESFGDVLRIIDHQAASAAVFVKGVDNSTASTQIAQRVAQALGNGVDTPKTLAVHSVSVTFQGSYQQVRQFIQLMENAVRFMDITGITLTKAADQADLLDGTLTAHFYSLVSP